MKNMKVSMKLMVSFLIVVALAIGVGAVGFIGMMYINDGSTAMYEEQASPMVYIGEAIEFFQRIRVQLGYMVIASGNEDLLRATEADLIDRAENFSYNMELYLPYIEKNGEMLALYNEIMASYSGFHRGVLDAVALAWGGSSQEELMAFKSGNTDAPAVFIGDALGDLRDLKIVAMGAQAESNASVFQMMNIIIIVALVIAVSIAMTLAFYISRIISKPLSVLTEFMKKAAATGDIEFSDEEESAVQVYSKNKDELGQCLDATAEFVHEINREMDKLEKVANGDLTIDVSILSPDDKIGKTLTKVVENLNSMFAEINTASSQVSAGSKQIANGAQALAQGSTQQAASVQELSAAISEIAEKTKANASTAGRTAQMSTSIRESAEKGSRQMDEMITAVSDINEASKSISNIIKTIDDIAFQTNILALNAAVEAARAGQHGKGFAVVAEEVRNLASKSAEAAKDTGTMIQNSMEKAELGSRIASETAESLSDIVSGISESGKLITEIAEASEAQSQGISEINTGIDQVAQVVQQNSATAEESSAASQEMSGQSDMLQQLVAQFKLKSTSGFKSLPPTSVGNAQESESISVSAPQPAHSTDEFDFGKY